MGQKEAAKMSFVGRVADLANQLRAIRKEAWAIQEEWDETGFSGTGDSELTETDLTNTQFQGITKSEIADVITALRSFETTGGFFTDHATKLMKFMR